MPVYKADNFVTFVLSLVMRSGSPDFFESSGPVQYFLYQISIKCHYK
jgi:hypothetical protein